MIFNKNKIIKICDYLIEIGILAAIFFVPIYFVFTKEYYNYNIFELNKIVLFRVLLLVVLSSYIAKIFIQGKIFYKGRLKILIFPLFLSLVFFISSFLSIHPNLSFWGSYDRQQGLYSLVSYLLFFILLILNLTTWRQIKLLLITIIASSFFVCFYGLVQFFSLDPLDWKEKFLYTGRIFSTLGQPNFLGQYLILVIPVSFYALFFISKRFLSRFIVVAVILAQLACLVLTYSRAAWLGFLFSCAFFATLLLLAKGKRKFIFSLAVAVGIFVFILFICPYLFNQFNKISADNKIYEVNVVDRLKSGFNLESGSNKIRLYYWQAAFRELQTASPKRLIFGYGPETLFSVFVKYYQPDWGVYEKINSFPDKAHNSIFDALLSLGLLGFFVICLFWCFIIVKTIKYLLKNSEKGGCNFWLATALLAALLGYFINNLFSFSTTTGYVYLFLFAALLWASINHQEDEREFNIYFLGRFSRLLIWVMLFFVCCLFIYYQNFSMILADYYYVKARKAEKRMDCRKVFDNMEKVVSYDPISTFYKERYIYHYLNCFEAAASEKSQQEIHDNIIIQANSIGPHEFQFLTWLNVAHAKSLFGYYINPTYYGAAEEDYKKLIKINPFITSTYKDLGRMKLWQEDYAAAIDNFKKAIEAAPPISHKQLNQEHKKEIGAELAGLYRMLAMAYSYENNFEEALAHYRESLKIDPYQLPVYKKMADIFYQQGEIEQAIFYNRRGLTLNPDDYHWYFSLALLFGEKGERGEALNYAEKALMLSPDNEEIIKFIKDN